MTVVAPAPLRASAATGRLVRLLEQPDPNPEELAAALAAGPDLKWVALSGAPLVLHAIKRHPRQVPGINTSQQALVNKLRPLLEAGTAIARSPAGETPLSNTVIALGDAPAVIALLLKHGADPDEPTTGPAFGALDQAVSCGALSTTRLLLEAGAKPDGLSGKATRLALEYHSTLAAGDTACALLRALLEAGARHSPEDSSEPTPLLLAIDGGQYGAAIALLDAGADPDSLRAGAMLKDNTPFKRALNRFSAFESTDPQTGQAIMMGADPNILSADGASLRELLSRMEGARLERDTPISLTAPGRTLRL